MMRAKLLGLVFSPWTEKARFALDARSVAYDFEHYQPMLGEPMLRAKLGKWRGRVTVPVLTDEAGRVHADSAEIARWADGRGEGPELFPEAHAHAIDEWVALSEAALAAWRALSLARMLESPAALAEMVPRPLRALPKAASAVGALGIRRTLRKYGAHGADPAESRRTLESALEKLRAALARPGAAPRTILDRFTFADIAMAQVAVALEPPKTGLRVGAASRSAFSDTELRARFADIADWRDALYERYRHPR